MFIAFDETDEFAHEAKYKEYLFAANTFDKYLADLWNYCQNNSKYKDKTTFIITTDHGRGDKIKSEWTNHGQNVLDSNEIWLVYYNLSLFKFVHLYSDDFDLDSTCSPTYAQSSGSPFPERS